MYSSFISSGRALNLPTLFIAFNIELSNASDSDDLTIPISEILPSLCILNLIHEYNVLFGPKTNGRFQFSSIFLLMYFT